MQELVLSVAMILSLIVQLGLLAHCFKFKQELPVMYSSMKSNGMELKDIVHDAYSVLLDMVEMLDDSKLGARSESNAVQSPSESIMTALTHGFINNLMPTAENGGKKEVHTENEVTNSESEIGN